MQKLMTMLIAGEADARVEVWLERDRGHGQPWFHAVSYRGTDQLERSSVHASGDEAMAVSARRLCRQLCKQMGWSPA